MKWINRHLLRSALAFVVLVLLLLLIDAACYRVTVPVTLEIRHQVMTVRVGSIVLPLHTVGVPTTLDLPVTDPVVHEYQIDGTDSTNNRNLDQTYLQQLAQSPYYRFQSWMRDFAGTSRWTSIAITEHGHATTTFTQPPEGTQLILPRQADVDVSLQLQRPETPRTLDVSMLDHSRLHITLNRNDRFIKVTRTADGMDADATEKGLARTFFPQDPWPFAAMIVSFVARTLLWSLAVLLLVVIGDLLLASLWQIGGLRLQRIEVQTGEAARQASIRRRWTGRWQSLTRALHPVALLALAGSFCFVLWIAKVQYNGMPHIYDANAYYFAAKMYAQGHLSVPLPPAAEFFPGPFMLQFAGRWFAQYPLGTALTLVPGMWLGLPWLIEPLCGTLSLLGIGLVTARLYNRQVATLAVLLGTLSPFYSYLAASYLSHAVALFYLIWGWWALLRFLQGGRAWNLYVAACCFGMGALTRDLFGILFVVLISGGSLLLSWQQLRVHWRKWCWPLLGAGAILLCFMGISLAFNFSLTKNAFTSPRSLFFSGDRWGFGPGVGFYGQHTLAAGLVNLDELLTSLATQLFGWPFYLTLACLGIPFLTGRAKRADWLLLLCFLGMAGACIGYFYHGIYLGPRYLFETLPFLLALTARGLCTLATIGQSTTQSFVHSYKQQPKHATVSMRWSVTTILVVASLIACNLCYYLPRQIEVHQNYGGLPSGYTIDLSTLYQPKLHQAIVVTNDYALYQMVLFPLNDPLLKGDVIYALAGDPGQYAQLHTAYPGRKIYQISLDDHGVVHYEAADD